MAREILFRGKRVDNGEWVYGCLIYDKYCNSDVSYIGYLTTDGVDVVEVLSETVGQYIGLTDTNGKKIFEGDIVLFAKNIYQIIFACGSFVLYDPQGEMISKIGGHNDHCFSLMPLYVDCCWEDGCAYDIEVIGNIHDNPELLERGCDNG